MKKTISLGYIFSSIFLGLSVGILTVIGQTYLPGNFNSIANSGAMWLIPAYFISLSFSSAKQSIISCTLCLINSVVGYYFFESIWNSHSFIFFSYYMFLWLICAVIAGTIFGIAANCGKSSKNVFYNNLGKAMLPAVFMAEGLNILFHRKDYLHMINVGYAWIVISFILVIIIYKKNILKKESILSLILATILGLLFYKLLFIIT
jgi:hypothetical protein